MSVFLQDPVHCMLDIETLGTEPGYIVVSIGAVKFTAEKIIEEFSVVLERESQRRLGLKTSKSTVDWWNRPEQREAAERIKQAEKKDTAEALKSFSRWLGGEIPVWGNSARFDNAILEKLYHVYKLSPPWPFWKDRCYRTVKNLRPDIELERQGTYHDALDDARSQAVHLQKLLKGLELS
jgi:DNA polymerase III alpha subunit (gram-positive type)